MRQSQLFSRTSKEAPKDEVALNAQLLVKAGFVEKLTAGVYTLLPLGLMVVKNIEAIIRKEMRNLGANEVLLPALHPKANWEKTGRWDTYDSLFRFKSHYTETDYAFGPTHEEIISPLMQKFISSYRDLPVSVFQIQTKFRDEKRAKSGLMRGREFIMKDLYSFHADEKDLDTFYEKATDSYRRIFDICGLGEKTYLTYASGGTFSKYSHEFQTLTDAGEDTIYLCENCQVAVNKEIIDEQNECPKCKGTDLKELTAVEVGNIFKLKTKYSEPFELKYKDEKGESKEVVMGCYGIGVTRLLGTIAEIYHDDRGFMWPISVAPASVHLIGLPGGQGDKIYADLQAAGLQVLYDDRSASTGEKFADADLIGLPYRVVTSTKTGDQIEVKARSSKEAELMDFDKFLELAK
jgi:prolyl-tRNA synthetase